MKQQVLRSSSALARHRSSFTPVSTPVAPRSRANAGGGCAMLTIPNPENVYLACGPIDLRKSIDSLAALVQ
ncbi:MULTISPECIES: hypothetical protein [Paenibacillus]|uniref:hypothetical protein n=1 Tax=Paenibacillus TaxID=44249 RepID=UPI0021B36704|nr:hypothetical protein [Paenibacillus sp. IHBB 10380]